MTLTTKITCDACGTALNTSSAILVQAPTGAPCHFCNIRCIARWATALDNARAAESRAWDIHRAQIDPVGVPDTGTASLDRWATGAAPTRTPPAEPDPRRKP